MKRTRLLSLLILCAACLFGAGTASANGVVRDSLGAISSGRGGANLAHEDNLSAINDNPASLAWLKENFRLELGSDFLLRDVKYRDADDSGRSRNGLFILPQLGIAGRLPDTSITVGLGVFFPAGYGAEYRLDHSLFGREDYESHGMLLKILPSVSFKLGDYVSIGGGVGLGYSSARFELPYTFQTGALAGATGRVESDTDGFGVVGNFGIQVRPTDRLTFGIAYIEETLTRQKGDFDLDVTGSGLPVTDPTASYDVRFDMKWPRSLAAGASYRFDCGRVALDGVWYDWSSAFDEIHFKLSKGNNAEFDAIAGRKPEDMFPLDWRDSISVRAGYEHYFGDDTTVRVGYIYNLNPIPDGTLTPLLPATLQHSFSIGFGHRWRMVEIDAAYQYAFGPVQKVNQSDIIGGDFDSSEIRAQAHWFFLSLAISI